MTYESLTNPGASAPDSRAWKPTSIRSEAIHGRDAPSASRVRTRSTFARAGHSLVREADAAGLSAFAAAQPTDQPTGSEAVAGAPVEPDSRAISALGDIRMSLRADSLASCWERSDLQIPSPGLTDLELYDGR